MQDPPYAHGCFVLRRQSASGDSLFFSRIQRGGVAVKLTSSLRGATEDDEVEMTRCGRVCVRVQRSLLDAAVDEMHDGYLHVHVCMPSPRTRREGGY